MFEELYRKYFSLINLSIAVTLSIVAGPYLLLIYIPSKISQMPVLTGVICTTQTQIHNTFFDSSGGLITVGASLVVFGIVLFLIALFFCGIEPNYEIENKIKNKSLEDFMNNLSEILYKGKIVFSVTNKKKNPQLVYITIEYLDKNYILFIKDVHVQDKVEKDISKENN